MKIKLALIIFAFFLKSCSNEKLNHIEFARYMKEVFKIDIKKHNCNNIYYPIHMQGCHSCLKRNIDLLLKINTSKNDFTPILVGVYRKRKLDSLICKLQKKHSCIIDKKQKIFHYRTNFAKPLLVHIKNGKIKLYKEVVDKYVPNVYKYLKNMNKEDNE